MVNPIAKRMNSRIPWEMGYWAFLWGVILVRVRDKGRLPTVGGTIP